MCLVYSAIFVAIMSYVPLPSWHIIVSTGLEDSISKYWVLFKNGNNDIAWGIKDWSQRQQSDLDFQNSDFRGASLEQ